MEWYPRTKQIERVVLVKKGDNLWNIAGVVYKGIEGIGQGRYAAHAQWPKIYAGNKDDVLKSRPHKLGPQYPDTKQIVNIRPGDKLVVPGSVNLKAIGLETSAQVQVSPVTPAPETKPSVPQVKPPEIKPPQVTPQPPSSQEIAKAQQKMTELQSQIKQYEQERDKLKQDIEQLQGKQKGTQTDLEKSYKEKAKAESQLTDLNEKIAKAKQDLEDLQKRAPKSFTQTIRNAWDSLGLGWQIAIILTGIGIIFTIPFLLIRVRRRLRETREEIRREEERLKQLEAQRREAEQKTKKAEELLQQKLKDLSVVQEHEKKIAEQKEGVLKREQVIGLKTQYLDLITQLSQIQSVEDEPLLGQIKERLEQIIIPKELETDLSELKHLAQATLTQAQNRIQQAKDIQAELEERQKRIEELEVEVIKLKEQIEEVVPMPEVQNLQQQVDALIKEVAGLKDERTLYLQRIGALTEEINNLRQAIKKSIPEQLAATLRSQLRELQKRREELQRTMVIELKKELEDIWGKKQRIRGNLTRILREQLEAIRDRFLVLSIEAAHASQRKKAEEFISKTQNLINQIIPQLSVDINSLIVSIDEVRRVFDVSETAEDSEGLAKLKASLDEETTKINQINTDVIDLEREARNIISRLNTIITQIDELMVRPVENLLSLQQRGQEALKLAGNIDTLIKNTDSYQDNISESRGKLAELLSQSTERKAKLALYRDIITSYLPELAKAKSIEEFERLRQNVFDTRIAPAQLPQDLLERIETEIAGAKDKIAVIPVSLLEQLARLSFAVEKLNSRDLIYTLYAYLGIYSPSCNETPMAEKLIEDAKSIINNDAKVEIRVQNDICGIAIDIIGKNKELKPIIISAHMDTKTWAKFENVLIDVKGEEQIKCRDKQASIGLDDKAAEAVITEVIRAINIINPEFKRTIRLIFTVQEEAGYVGARNFVNRHRQILEEAALMISIDGQLYCKDSSGKPIEPIDNPLKVKYINFSNPNSSWQNFVKETISEASQLIIGRSPFEFTFSAGDEGVFAEVASLPIAHFRANYVSDDLLGHKNDRVDIQNLVYLADWLVEILCKLDNYSSTEASPIVKKVSFWQRMQTIMTCYVNEEGRLIFENNRLETDKQLKLERVVRVLVNKGIYSLPVAKMVKIRIVTGSNRLASRDNNTIIIDLDAFNSEYLLLIELEHEILHFVYKRNEIRVPQALEELSLIIREILSFLRFNPNQQNEVISVLREKSRDIDNLGFYKLLEKAQREEINAVIEDVVEYMKQEGVYPKEIKEYLETKSDSEIKRDLNFVTDQLERKLSTMPGLRIPAPDLRSIGRELPITTIGLSTSLRNPNGLTIIMTAMRTMKEKNIPHPTIRLLFIDPKGGATDLVERQREILEECIFIISFGGPVYKGNPFAIDYKVLNRNLYERDRVLYEGIWEIVTKPINIINPDAYIEDTGEVGNEEARELAKACPVVNIRTLYVEKLEDVDRAKLQLIILADWFVEIFIQLGADANSAKGKGMFTPEEHAEVNEVIEEAQREGRGLLIWGDAQGWKQTKDGYVQDISLAISRLRRYPRVHTQGLGTIDIPGVLNASNIVLIQPRDNSLPGLVVKSRDSYQIAHSGKAFNSIYIDGEIYRQLYSFEIAVLLAHETIELYAKRLAREKRIPWTVELAKQIHRLAEEYEIKIVGKSPNGRGSCFDDRIEEMLDFTNLSKKAQVQPTPEVAKPEPKESRTEILTPKPQKAQAISQEPMPLTLEYPEAKPKIIDNLRKLFLEGLFQNISTNLHAKLDNFPPPLIQEIKQAYELGRVKGMPLDADFMVALALFFSKLFPNHANELVQYMKNLSIYLVDNTRSTYGATLSGNTFYIQRSCIEDLLGRSVTVEEIYQGIKNKDPRICVVLFRIVIHEIGSAFFKLSHPANQELEEVFLAMLSKTRIKLSPNAQQEIYTINRTTNLNNIARIDWALNTFFLWRKFGPILSKNLDSFQPFIEQNYSPVEKEMSGVRSCKSGVESYFISHLPVLYSRPKTQDLRPKLRSSSPVEKNPATSQHGFSKRQQVQLTNNSSTELRLISLIRRAPFDYKRLSQVFKVFLEDFLCQYVQESKKDGISRIDSLREHTIAVLKVFIQRDIQIKGIEKKRVFRIAILFHDIGKVISLSNHEELSDTIIREQELTTQLVKIHLINDMEAKLIEVIVGYHLLMGLTYTGENRLATWEGFFRDERLKQCDLKILIEAIKEISIYDALAYDSSIQKAKLNYFNYLRGRGVLSTTPHPERSEGSQKILRPYGLRMIPHYSRKTPRGVNYLTRIKILSLISDRLPQEEFRFFDTIFPMLAWSNDLSSSQDVTSLSRCVSKRLVLNFRYNKLQIEMRNKLFEGSGSFTHNPSSRAKRGISKDPSALRPQDDPLLFEKNSPRGQLFEVFVVIGDRKGNVRLWLIWLEGDYSFTFIKAYYKLIENILLTEKIKISTQMTREAKSSRQPDMANFDRKGMKIDRNKTSIPDHNIGNFTWGVVKLQISGNCGQEDRDTCTTIYVYFGFQWPDRSFGLDLNNWIEFIFIDLVRKVNLFLHKIWTNSSGPGTGILNGTVLGNRSFAIFTASFPVKISPWLITILCRGYFFTNFSKFFLTNKSLSMILLLIFTSSLQSIKAIKLNVNKKDFQEEGLLGEKILNYGDLKSLEGIIGGPITEMKQISGPNLPSFSRAIIQYYCSSCLLRDLKEKISSFKFVSDENPSEEDINKLNVLIFILKKA